MSNLMFKSLALAAVLAHLGALAWAAGLRRGMRPAVLLNLCLACAVLGHWIDRLDQVSNTGDYRAMALIGFELVTAATSILVLCEMRVPRVVVWLQFSGHFLFAAAFATFAFTFQLVRLM